MSDPADDDLRSTLLSAVNEVEERDPGSTGQLADVAKAETTKAEPSKVTATPETTSETKDKQLPPKGADGKFQKAEVKTQPVKDQPNATGVTAGTEVKTLAAPAQWRQEAKAAWDAIPEAQRKILSDEIAKREKDFSQGIEAKANEFKQIKSQFDEIEPILGPRRAALAANYGSVNAALDRLFKLSDFASTDAQGFISWFSQNAGVDLPSLIQGQAAAPQVAPEIASLQQTINGLTQRLQNFEGQTQQQQVKSVASELESFEKEADESGNAKHPHYVTLRDGGHLLPEMQLVRSQHPEWSTRQIIDQAYDNTVWKFSDTRNQLLSQREQQAKDTKEAQERAEAASRARKFTPGGPPGKYVPDDDADDLRATIAKEFYAKAGNARL